MTLSFKWHNFMDIFGQVIEKMIRLNLINEITLPFLLSILFWVSMAIRKTWLKATWEEKGLFNLLFYCPLWEGLRAGIQGRTWSIGHAGRAPAGLPPLGLLSLLLIEPRTTFPRVDCLQWSGPSTSSVTHENATWTYLRDTLMERFSELRWL